MWCEFNQLTGTVTLVRVYNTILAHLIFTDSIFGEKINEKIFEEKMEREIFRFSGTYRTFFDYSMVNIFAGDRANVVELWKKMIKKKLVGEEIDRFDLLDIFSYGDDTIISTFFNEIKKFSDGFNLCFRYLMHNRYSTVAAKKFYKRYKNKIPDSELDLINVSKNNLPLAFKIIFERTKKEEIFYTKLCGANFIAPDFYIEPFGNYTIVSRSGKKRKVRTEYSNDYGSGNKEIKIAK